MARQMPLREIKNPIPADIGGSLAKILRRCVFFLDRKGQCLRLYVYDKNRNISNLPPMGPAYRPLSAYVLTGLFSISRRGQGILPVKTYFPRVL